MGQAIYRKGFQADQNSFRVLLDLSIARKTFVKIQQDIQKWEAGLSRLIHFSIQTGFGEKLVASIEQPPSSFRHSFMKLRTFTLFRELKGC
jgi:hypothetical protein